MRSLLFVSLLLASLSSPVLAAGEMSDENLLKLYGGLRVSDVSDGMDMVGLRDTGSVGSLNGLYWIGKGAVGIVSNGGIRDSDERIKERVPVYFDVAHRGRGIRPGGNEIESAQRTVSIAGVQINPGDVIVADGDGVIPAEGTANSPWVTKRGRRAHATRSSARAASRSSRRSSIRAAAVSSCPTAIRRPLGVR